jgi:hypothetical protein
VPFSIWVCLKKLAGGEQFFWDTLTNKNNFHNPIRMDLVRNPIVANAPTTKRKKYKLVYDDGRPDVMVNQEAVERGKRMLEKDEAIDEARERLARAEKEVAEARAHLERLLREAEPAPAPSSADMFFKELDAKYKEALDYLNVKRTEKEAIDYFNRWQQELVPLYAKYRMDYAGAVDEAAGEFFDDKYWVKWSDMNKEKPKAAPKAKKAAKAAKAAPKEEGVSQYVIDRLVNEYLSEALLDYGYDEEEAAEKIQEDYPEALEIVGDGGDYSALVAYVVGKLKGYKPRQIAMGMKAFSEEGATMFDDYIEEHL